MSSTIYTAFETPHPLRLRARGPSRRDAGGLHAPRRGPARRPRLDLHLFADTGEDGAFDVGEDLAHATWSLCSAARAATATFVTGPDEYAAGPVVAGTWTIAVDPDQLELAEHLASTPALPASIVVAATGTTARGVGFVQAGEGAGIFVAAIDLLFQAVGERCSPASCCASWRRLPTTTTTTTASSASSRCRRPAGLAAPDQPLLLATAVQASALARQFVASDLALVPCEPTMTPNTAPHLRRPSLWLALALLGSLAATGQARAQADTNISILDPQFYGEGTYNGQLAVTRSFDYPYVSFHIHMDTCGDASSYDEVPVQLRLKALSNGTVYDVLVREKLCPVSSCGGAAPFESRCWLTPDWGTAGLVPLMLDISDSQADWTLQIVVDPTSANHPDGVVPEDDSEDWEVNVVSSDDGLLDPYPWEQMPAPFANKVRFGGASGALVNVENPVLTGGPTYFCLESGLLRYEPGSGWEPVPIPIGTPYTLCGNLSERMTYGYELVVNSGQTGEFFLDGALAGTEARLTASLGGSGVILSHVVLTLPRGHGFHGGGPEGPSPRGERVIERNISQVRSHPSETSFYLSYGHSWITSETLPLSIGGNYPQLVGDAIVFMEQVIHYRFDLDYHPFDQRNLDKKGPESNDIRFKNAEIQAGFAGFRAGGILFNAHLPPGSGRLAFPKGTLTWGDNSAEIDSGRVILLERNTAALQTFTFTATTGCPGCGGSPDGPLQTTTVALADSARQLETDGRVFGKTAAGFMPQWGPQKVMQAGEGDGPGFVYRRPDDAAIPAMLNLPGYALDGSEDGLTSATDILLAPVVDEMGVSVPNPIGSDEAQRGNGFFPGVTLGPETYRGADGQPVVGAGATLETTTMKIAIGGPQKAWQTVPSSPGTKLFARPSGVTGSFNFDSVPAGGSFSVYGFPFAIDRFAFRTVDNETDKFTWFDGRVSVLGRADFGIPFRSLVLQCSGHLGSGLVDGALLTPQRLKAWNAAFDIATMAFVAQGASGQCGGLDRKLEAGGGVRIEAFDTKLDLAATWNPDGTTVGNAKLTGKNAVELHRPTSGTTPDDKPRRGFDLALTTATLEWRESCDYSTPSTSDACGWFTFGAKAGVPFWNALDVKLRATNVSAGTPTTFKAGQSIVAKVAYTRSDWLTETLPNLIALVKADLAAGIEAENNWVFDVEMPVRWAYDAGPAEYPRFIADPLDQRSTDLKVISIKGAADYITEYSTKLSFGAAADLTKLNAPTIALNVDLTDKESVTKIDNFIEGIIPGMSASANPVEKAVGVLQNPAGLLLKATGGGFDSFLKDGIREVIEGQPIRGITDDFAGALAAVQRIPLTVANQIFDGLKSGIDSAITSLFDAALGAPDQLALDLYDDLPTAWVGAANAYKNLRAYAQNQSGQTYQDLRTAFNTVRDAVLGVAKLLSSAGASGLVEVLETSKKGVDLALGAVSDARKVVTKLSTDVTTILTTAKTEIGRVLTFLNIEAPNSNTPLNVLKCPGAGDPLGNSNPLLKKINEIEGIVKNLTTALAGKGLEKLGQVIGGPIGVDLKFLKTADELFGNVAGAITRKILGDNTNQGVLKKVKGIICDTRANALVNRLKTLTAKVRALIEPIQAQLVFLTEEIPLTPPASGTAPRIKVTVMAIDKALAELEGVPNPPADDKRVTLHALKKQLSEVAQQVKQLNALVQQFSVELPETPPPQLDQLLAQLPDFPELYYTTAQIQARMNTVGTAALTAIGLDSVDLGTFAGWVDNATNPSQSFVKKLPDAIRKPVNQFIGVVQSNVGQQIAGAMAQLPFPTGKQMREMILQMILESPFIEQLDKLFHEGMAFLLSEINSVSTKFLQQVNELIKAVVAKFSETANQLLAGAVAEIKDSLGFSAAGITGYGVITQNDIERIHLEATFSMNKTKKSDEKPATGEQKSETETQFKASLDATSWKVNGKAKGCGIDVSGSAPLDVKIGAENLPIKFGPGDGMSLKKLEIGFTIWDDPNDSPDGGLVPIGFFGGITTAGKMSFKAFELSDIAFVVGGGKLETYLGAKARANFQGTVVQVAFLAGKMCSLEVLNTLDPMASKFIKIPEGGTFTGAYVRGSASFPFINLGCLLTVGANADVGVWVFADEQDNWSVGGLVGGGIYGKAICLVSAKGKVTLLGQYANDQFTFLGEGWVAGGIGFCEPEEWNTPADVANDGWCGTAMASIQARYEGGSFNISDPSFSGID